MDSNKNKQKNESRSRNAKQTERTMQFTWTCVEARHD